MTDPDARGLAAAVAEQFSFEQSVGGVRGLLESVVPVGVFTLVYVVAHSIPAASLAAVGVALAALVLRIVTRLPVTPAVSGLLGVVISAGVAWFTGQAINFFLMSIIKNIGLGLLFAVSSLVGWPLVGVLLGVMLGEGFHWREVPARRRVYHQATWVWVAMSGVRLGVQIPLYLHDRVGGLGAASVPLGLPLFGVVLLLTWLLVRRVPVARPPKDDEDDGDDEDAEDGTGPDDAWSKPGRATEAASDPV